MNTILTESSVRLSSEQSDLFRAAAVYRWSVQLAPEVEDPGLLGSLLEELAVLGAHLDDPEARA